MTGKTLLMALGVGVVVGLLLGIGLVGLIGANREQAASTTPPPRSVNGATLDTVFIHHATPENTSGNSTYLHSPATVVSGRYSTRTARRCPWGLTSTWPS